MDEKKRPEFKNDVGVRRKKLDFSLFSLLFRQKTAEKVEKHFKLVGIQKERLCVNCTNVGTDSMLMVALKLNLSTLTTKLPAFSSFFC